MNILEKTAPLSPPKQVRTLSATVFHLLLTLTSWSWLWIPPLALPRRKLTSMILADDFYFQVMRSKSFPRLYLATSVNTDTKQYILRTMITLSQGVYDVVYRSLGEHFFDRNVIHRLSLTCSGEPHVRKVRKGLRPVRSHKKGTAPSICRQH